MPKVIDIISALTNIANKEDNGLNLPLLLHITLTTEESNKEPIQCLIPIEAIGIAEGGQKKVAILKATVTEDAISPNTAPPVEKTRQSLDKCFTQDQLNTCLEIIRSTPDHQQANAICEKVLCPEAMRMIDSATGQKNDQKFVAYTLIHLLSKIK